MTLNPKRYLILIADRNPHVRGYLEREMINAGYKVKLAGSYRNVVETLNGSQQIDGIIIDPDLPGVDIGAKQAGLNPGPRPIPVIVHTLLKKNGRRFFFSPWEISIEKSGNSVEQLKQTLGRLFDADR